MKYIVNSLIFGLQAYAICSVYLLASTVSLICAVLRFIFAPFAFTEKFMLRGIFNELGALEYFLFHLAHSIMVTVRAAKSADSIDTNRL